MFFFIFSANWNMLSWEKARSNLYRLQKRIFKSVLVGDIQKCLQIQKLLLSSNSASLLAIRFVSQNENKLLFEFEEKISLSFIEKFELVKFLQKNVTNWLPQKCKKNYFTFADQSCQTLVKFALEPAHEATFNPRNFGFRNSLTVFDAQKLLFLNLSKSSYGFQKRILIFNIQETFYDFNPNVLLKKIIISRSIKLVIFRFLKSGLFPSLKNFSSSNNLQNLLANVLLNGIENINNSIRYGSCFLVFLTPFDNESLVVNKINKFLVSLGFNNLIKDYRFYSPINGFDFLNWHFKVCSDFSLYCSPSTENYRNFLKRVKLIINNSNYGSSVKMQKISPIIKDWKIYNQFCNLKNFKTSLFFLQKKAFKSFNKESKNDRYSTKQLINKSFFNINSLAFKKTSLNNRSFFYDVHVLFWFENKRFCIYCGLNTYNNF